MTRRSCSLSRYSSMLLLLGLSLQRNHAWMSRVAPFRSVAVSDNTIRTKFLTTSLRVGRPSVDFDATVQTQEFDFQNVHHHHAQSQLPTSLSPITYTSSSTINNNDELPSSVTTTTSTESLIQSNIETVLNGLLLIVCFGYAAYTILNIDHGMTRGWTQSEIVLRVPLDNWNNYETALQEKPIFTKTLINVVIYLLGDWLAQTLFQGKNALEFDAMRTLRNGLIGLGFGPLVHEYYQFSDHILPVEAGMLTRLEKIIMDQTLYLTVKCSIYIMAVGLLSGQDFEEAVNNVKSRIKGIVFTAWKFWPLVHCVTYGLVPARHRILWVNCVDLVWNAILATMSRSTSEPQAEPELFSDAATLEPEVASLVMYGNATDTMLDPFLLTQDLVPSAAMDSTMEMLEHVQVDLVSALGDGRNTTGVSLAS